MAEKSVVYKLEEKGVVYQGGIVVRKPTLSFEKKTKFSVEAAGSGK